MNILFIAIYLSIYYKLWKKLIASYSKVRTPNNWLISMNIRASNTMILLLLMIIVAGSNAREAVI